MATSDSKPPLPERLNIVALETFYTPLPEITPPANHTVSITEYRKTTADEVPSRIRDAHILVTTTVPLRAAHLSADACPDLRLILALASGTDTIDLAACRERGIRVLNSPGCNADVVAEHAVALYFASRRSVVPTMRQLRAGGWTGGGSLMESSYAAGLPPRGCRDETVAVVGHGGVGRRVEALFRALGSRVVVAARKGCPPGDVPGGRVPFDEALREATVLVLCCPRSPETLGMMAGPEFAAMRSDALLVNVARGGIVDEAALLEALRGGDISGAGVDVFAKEPAGPETSPLLGPDAADVNLVATPHSAWVGMDTTANYHRVLAENLHDFVAGTVKADRVKA